MALATSRFRRVFTVFLSLAMILAMIPSFILGADAAVTEVTAHDSSELETYLNTSEITTIDLVAGTEYTLDGRTLTRDLTINGNGATINVGTAISGTVVKMTGMTTSGAVFLEVSGSSLTLNNVTLNAANTLLLCGINVKSGGSLLLDGVTFTGFFGNPADNTVASSVNNFGVHAEPESISTTISNCTFGSSNAFRNVIAVRGGTAVIVRNTFEGTAYPERLNDSDGYEYAIYLYGGTSTVVGNAISGFLASTRVSYTSSGIAICPYDSVIASMMGNSIANSAGGINITGSWQTLSTGTVTVGGTLFHTTEDGFRIGETLLASNRFSGNLGADVSLARDQNDYYKDVTTNADIYWTSAYSSDLLSASDITPGGVTLHFTNADLMKNGKSFALQMSADNGATWQTMPAAITPSTASLNLDLSKGTYRFRLALTIASYVQGASDPAPVPMDLTCYSNAVRVEITLATAVPLSSPSATTVSASGVTETGATFSGAVTQSNGATVTDRGFVYGASPDPVIGGAGVVKVAAGSGEGSFMATVTGLTGNTTYYVRAYAVNSQGTSYGATYSFTTAGTDEVAIPQTGDSPAIPMAAYAAGLLLAAICSLALMRSAKAKN